MKNHIEEAGRKEFFTSLLSKSKQLCKDRVTSTLEEEEVIIYLIIHLSIFYFSHYFPPFVCHLFYAFFFSAND
jgi:hypothetical protein